MISHGPTSSGMGAKPQKLWVQQCGDGSCGWLGAPNPEFREQYELSVMPDIDRVSGRKEGTRSGQGGAAEEAKNRDQKE